jgi:hypothetical protein
MAGAVMTPSGAFTLANVSGFWWNNDDVASATPAALTDRIGGHQLTPAAGAANGTMEATGWGGQQKSVLQSAMAWECTAAGVVSKLTGGRNFWLLLVGQQLATNASPAVAPDQTLLSAGDTTDAQKYWALQGRNKVAATIGGFQFASQRWIQRFGAAAETQDESNQPQGPFPYIWLLQVSAGGAQVFTRDGLAEQSFTRDTGGALTVNKLVVGGLIAGASVTPDGRFRWRELAGNSGNLTAPQIAQVLAAVNSSSRGFGWKRGVVSQAPITKVYVYSPEWDQSNGQDQSTSPTLTATNCFMLGFNNFVGPLASPWCNPTGTPFTSVFINSGVGAPNAFANKMQALGKFNPATQALFFLPAGVGGSSMGSFWCKNLTTDPWGWDAPVGAVCLRREEIFRNAQSPEMLPAVDYQGESDTLTFAQADGWDDANRAPACAGKYVTWTAARGYTLKAGVQERIICILPVTNWTSATVANWNAQRAAATNAADVVIPNSTRIQVDSGPYLDVNNLHIGTAAQTNRYEAAAALS